MNESEPCTFVVDRGRYVSERGPCAKWATARLGDIPVCPSHLRKLENSITSAIQAGSYPGSAFGDDKRWYLMIRNAFATVGEDVRQAAKIERESARQATSVVYFMERDGFVKIGHSATLATRQQAISKGSTLIEGMTVGPVRLLATIPGGVKKERFMHEKFAAKRVGGEWFLLDDELWDFITKLKGYTGEPRQEGNRAA